MAAWGAFAAALEIRAGRKKTPSRGHSSAVNVIYRRQKGGGGGGCSTIRYFWEQIVLVG